VLNQFCEGVQTRMKKAGFDWTTLISTFLPVLLEMLTNCFPSAADLEKFASGKRGPLQLAGLRNKCRRVVQEQGVRGIFRISAAASDLQQAVLQELDEFAAKAAGADNIYRQALDEAASV
jgi:hypothetical protein